MMGERENEETVVFGLTTFLSLICFVFGFLEL